MRTNKSRTAAAGGVFGVIALKIKLLMREQEIEFNEIIKDIFSKELSTYGFYIQLEERGIVTFSSDKVSIRFVFGPRYNQICFFLKYFEFEVGIENFIVEQFLSVIEEYRFGDSSFQEFIIHWAQFRLEYLLKFKDSILLGDEKFYNELNSFFLNQIEIYNKNFKKS
jgi:hypothetical protein